MSARAGSALLAALAALGSGALPACGPARGASAGGSGEPVGISSAPRQRVQLLLERSDGMPVDVSEFDGQAVLLIAVRTDDVNSQATLRHAERLAAEHPDDLVVLAVVGDPYAPDQLRAAAQAFRSVLELRHVAVLLADDAVRAGSSALGSVERVPTTYLINRAGVIARRVEGYQDYAALAALVAPALPAHPAGQAPAPAPARETTAAPAP